MAQTLRNFLALKILLFSLGIQVLSVQCLSIVRITKEPKDFHGFMKLFRGFYDQYAISGNTLAFQWYHNGTKMQSSSGSGAIEFLGTTRMNLQLFEAKMKHQGIYQLYITSTHGRIFGREINVMYTIVGTFPDQTSQTHDVVIGKPYHLKCPSHTFTRNAVYKWGGTEVTQGTWFYPSADNVLVMDDGSLFFSYVTEEDVERIKNKDGVRCILDAIYQQDTRIEPSGPFLLNKIGSNVTSFGPVLQKIPNKEIVTGKFAIFRCIAAGYPAPTYTWEKISRLGEKERVIDQVNGIKLEEKNKLLTIEIVRKEHAGTYACTATSSDGTKSVTEQGVLRVRAAPEWVDGRDIKGANPEIFSKHVWTCIAKGDPEPEYEWYANATVMSNQSGRHTIEGGILTFHRLSLADNGMYQCVAKNKYGFEYQTAAMDVKYQIPVITKFAEQTTLIVDTIGVLDCDSDAIPKAKYSWLYNGSKLSIDQATSSRYELRDGKHLVIKNVSKDDAGVYTCEATNIFGIATKNSNVAIGEIVFTRRPQNKREMKHGDTINLHCEAISVPSLDIKYKWRFQDKQVKAKTNKLVVLKGQLIVFNSVYSDSGVYECVAYTELPSYAEEVSSAEVIVRGPPDAPVDLKLEGSCSNFKANLSWRIPYKNTYDPLTKLLLQWDMSSDPNKWYNVSGTVNTSLESYVVTGLNPWSNINFRIFAVNRFGMSKESTASDGRNCITPGAKPRKCPDNVKGKATGHGVIEVTWKEVPDMYRNGPSFNYIVSYRKANTGDWKRARVQSVPSPSYTITGAGVDELWEFKVQSNNSLGLGLECSPVRARSQKEAPTIAPSSFTYENLGPTYVDLKWKTVELVDNIILGYKIRYWRTQSESIVRRLIPTLPKTCTDKANACEATVPGHNSTKYKLEGLQPYNAYTLELHAYNTGGIGPASKPLVLTTEQSKPGAPHGIEATGYGRYIRMNWKAPKQPNGVITGYFVELKGEGIEGEKQKSEVAGNEITYLFKDLVPKRTYNFYIYAKTVAGAGKVTVKLVKTTEMRAPGVAKRPDVYGISEDSVNVTFKHGYSNNGGFPERFYVVYKEKGQDDEELKSTNATLINHDGQKSHMVVDGLKNGKKYMFATVVVNGDKSSGRSRYTEGYPVKSAERSESSPIYTKYWFYIIVALILLLLFVILLILFLRRKPKQTYKVGERERKHAPKNSDGYPLNPYDPDDDFPAKPNGSDVNKPVNEDPIKPKPAVPPLSTSPSRSPDRDSLDEYDGDDDDFSEHGSFIGQYGPGIRTGTSQSSLSNYV